MKILWDFIQSLLKFTTPYGTNWLNPVFMDLNIFLLLPFPVEVMFPERAMDRIGLMVSPTIRALEQVRAQFTFLCFKLGRVSFFIRFTILSEFVIVFQFMEAIALDTFGPLYSAWEGQMSPSPTIFTLENTEISVSASNCSNETSDVEAPIDKVLGFHTTLSIPYVDPYNSHVQFGWNFNDSWLRCKSDVVEDMVLFYDCFDIRCIEIVLEVSI